MTKNELYNQEVWIEWVGQDEKNPAHGETLLTVFVNVFKPHYFFLMKQQLY